LKGRPVKGALIDFWHADGAGDYDLKGFKCRGHQFTDADGRYSLETVVPGLYPGRTRHYHVRIQAAHGPVLTTQLFFPNEARNAEDSLFRRDLLLTMHDSGTAKVAAFDFVIRTA
jgi:protocatechuate 3,4-dioxygenase beta subunit